MSMEQLKADLRAPGLVVTKSDMLAAIEQLERQSGELMAQLQRIKAEFHVNMLRAFPDKSHSEIQAEIDRVSAAPTSLDSVQSSSQFGDAGRYLKVRLMNPRLFTEVCRKNITEGIPFDDLIDALEPDLSNFDDVIASSTGAVGATGQEGCGYQVRWRLTWPATSDKWTEWRGCSTAAAADYGRTPLQGGYEYEVRPTTNVSPVLNQGGEG